MKKILTTGLVIGILTSAFSAYAYELPHAFWALADRYQTALDYNDPNAIIDAGGKIVNLLENEEKNEQVNTILGAKLYDMGYAYEELGGVENHIKAGEVFRKYIPYGEALGWSDGVKIAKAKSMQFTPEIKLFTPTEEAQKYFGAKNEPEKGVLYGQVSEHYRDSESMILIYLEYGGSTDYTWIEHILPKARQGGKAVELALNFPREGNQLNEIINDNEYINSLKAVLTKYTDIPIYLRIGAEMNIWVNKADPELFKQAFIKVANEVRGAGSNIATVWSVVHSSEWSIDIEDYYPGDEYVDWVGISTYANRYFGGRNWPVKESHNPIVYKAGDAADPVLLIKEVVDKFGNRKPIMLAECGSAHYTGGEINDYSTQWAVTSLKRMYSMIPIVYPQVKLIAYFNTNISYETNYYDLEGCGELKAAYNEATKYPWFIQNSYKNQVQYSYKEIKDTITASGSLELYAYPHVYGYDVPTVNYYINGQWVGATSGLPYNKTIDLSGYPVGEYTLTADVDCGGFSAITKTCKLIVSGDELANLSETQRAALDYCKSIGIISGYEDGTIRPYGNITRAEFATMTALYKKLPVNEGCTFDDAEDHWASKFIRACVDVGAISGMGDNKYEPNSNITYEQGVTIMTSLAGLTGGRDLEALGGYPKAFLTIAEENSMLSGLEGAEVGKPLNRINAAVLFFNNR